MNPAKQLESAARLAIIVLAVGSPERIALARALNAVTKPKSAAKSDKTHKYAVCIARHDEHCYCADCAPGRLNGARSQTQWMADFGLSVKDQPKLFIPKMDAPDHSEELDRLATCACGHGSQAHREDEMNNLLECSAFIDAIGETCNCDHFHYTVKAAA